MSEGPSAPWLALKLAQALYDREPAALAPAERRRLAAAVRRQAEIERRILGSPEAAGVDLAPESVDAAWAEIQGRYPFPNARPGLSAAPCVLSEPVASPLGLHLLWCERIHPACLLPLHEVSDRIRAHLQGQRQAAAQRRWIAGLLRCG